MAGDHWIYQGRQYHQWFGHGTAPKEIKEALTKGEHDSLFDLANVGQRID